MQSRVKLLTFVTSLKPAWSTRLSARWCASGTYSVMRCLFVCMHVCLSVTFVNSVKTSNRIRRLFSPSDSQTIAVFAYTKHHGHIPTAWNPITGASNADGIRNKSRFWIGYRSIIDDWCEQQMRRRACSLPHRWRHSSLFITAWTTTTQKREHNKFIYTPQK